MNEQKEAGPTYFFGIPNNNNEKKFQQFDIVKPCIHPNHNLKI